MQRFKTALKPLLRSQAKQLMLALGAASEKSEQNCDYRLDFQSPRGWLRVKQFTNGTFYLEATDAELYHKALAQLSSITPVEQASTTATSPKSSSASKSTDAVLVVNEPYIGTDESGKGDYFGPLVIAGVFATPEQCLILAELGVQDSKALKDAQMRGLAADIKNVVGPTGFAVIEISPKRYNELYDKFKASGKNLNHLLAWGHAKALETILEKQPDCHLAIADKFGSEHYIHSQLKTLGKQIKLIQTPRAEVHTAVAAASILARVQFVTKLSQLSDRAGLRLPNGASGAVVQAGKALFRQQGRAALGEFAKLHFKTTDTVTSG